MMRRWHGGVVLLVLLQGAVDAIGEDGPAMTEQSAHPAGAARRAGAFKSVKVLNNLCWELLDTEVAEVQDTVRFSLPIDRWVWIHSNADVPPGVNREVRVTLDADTLPATVHRRTGSLEAMRFLRAGSHVLRIASQDAAKVTRIAVRAIPLLQYTSYGEDGHISPYGPYDWAFLKKDVLPNVNEILMNGHMFPVPEEIGAWKGAGRSWIVGRSAAWHLLTADPKGIMRFEGDPTEGADAVYEFWASANGIKHPLVNGLIIDEIGANNPEYDLYREAAGRLHALPEFSGKALNLYAYGEGLYSNERGRELMRFCIERDGTIATELYLLEEPTLDGAREKVATLTEDLWKWEVAMPGILPHLVAALCACSQPSENGDRYPNADFKVFMDMQMRELATDPACFALGGIQWYKSGYADEEVLRWSGRLFRHYCIDGNTEPMTSDPYELPHLANPDFEKGTEGWDVVAAEPGSVRAGEHEGYGRLQSRWGGGNDTFVLMKRSAKGPNTVSQTILHLTPGRLYSLKILSSDYGDLIQGRSRKGKNAIAIKIGNVELIDEPSKSFQFTYPHSYGRTIGEFTPQDQYWVNFHRRVFCPKGQTATLTMSDWQAESEAARPVRRGLSGGKCAGSDDGSDVVDTDARLRGVHTIRVQ